MTHLQKSLLAISIATICATPVFAEEKMTAKPGVPTFGQIMDASGIKVTGYIDTSYSYLSGTGTFLGGSASCSSPGIGGTSVNCNRVFDTERNSFNLNAVNVTVSTLPTTGFGGLVELNAGSDAKAITPAGSTNDEFDVTQAYVHYASGPFMAIAGKFVTLSGAEVIRGPDNLNLSRSILFGYAIPFTHTGVRGYYTLSDSVKFIAGVNNGWDVLNTSAVAPSDGKTFEAGVALTPIKPLSVSIAGYYGNAQPVVGVTPYGAPRYLLDVVAIYNISDTLSVTLNVDVAKQEDASAPGADAKWDGVAAYVNWKFAEKWRVAGRIEQFDDKNGFRSGLTQKWGEVTATLAYMPSASTELRGELRYDKSDAAAAFRMPDGSLDDNQHSVGVQAIYKF